jgi:hypothetical protein
LSAASARFAAAITASREGMRKRTGRVAGDAAGAMSSIRQRRRQHFPLGIAAPPAARPLPRAYAPAIAVVQPVAAPRPPARWVAARPDHRAAPPRARAGIAAGAPSLLRRGAARPNLLCAHIAACAERRSHLLAPARSNSVQSVSCLFASGALCGDVIARGIVARCRQLRGLAGAWTLPQPSLRLRPLGRHLRMLRQPPRRVCERSFPRLEPRRLPFVPEHHARSMQRHHRCARTSRRPPFRPSQQHFGADLLLRFARDAISAQ